MGTLQHPLAPLFSFHLSSFKLPLLPSPAQCKARNRSSYQAETRAASIWKAWDAVGLLLNYDRISWKVHLSSTLNKKGSPSNIIFSERPFWWRSWGESEEKEVNIYIWERLKYIHNCSPVFSHWSGNQHASPKIPDEKNKWQVTHCLLVTNYELRCQSFSSASPL